MREPYHPGHLERGMFGIITSQSVVVSEFQMGEIGDALSYHDDHFGRNNRHRNWRWSPAEGLYFSMGEDLDEFELDIILRHLEKRMCCRLDEAGLIVNQQIGKI